MKKTIVLFLALFTFYFVSAKDPYAGLSAKALKDKLALAESKLAEVRVSNDTLTELTDSLKLVAVQLDSLKEKLSIFVKGNLPDEKPESAWGWILVVLGIAAKILTPTTITVFLSQYLKIKTMLGNLFANAKGDGAGYWITLLVSSALGIGIELYANGLAGFSFEVAATKTGVISIAAFGLYHLGFYRLLAKIPALIKPKT